MKTEKSLLKRFALFLLVSLPALLAAAGFRRRVIDVETPQYYT